MNKKNSLRSRIVLSYLVLTVLVCTSFIIVFLSVEDYAENLLIYDAMSAQLERVVERGGHHSGELLSPGMTLYFGADRPDYLAGLTPRSKVYEIDYDDLELAVLVRQIDNRVYYVADDQSAFEKVEVLIVIAMLIALVVSLLLAVLFSKALTGRVILPLTQLTYLVRSDKLSSGEQTFSNDEIGFLAQAIEERNDKLKHFLAREKEFTGDVSHELRTPLTIILGAAEVLQARFSRHPQADELEYIERIRHTAVETTERISALLLLARSPDPTGGPRLLINDLVHKEVDRYRPLLNGKPVVFELELDTEVWVYVRPELAGIAIGNLIRNACQYTDEGRIRVSLSEGQLAVEDTGFGVPDSIRSDLFERFVRGNANDQAGSGLGLSIVKRVCEHIGWAVDYQPVSGGGSRFTLVFKK